MYISPTKTLDGDNSAQKEKGLLDRAKHYVSKFDEEKEQVLKHADKFNVGVEVVALVGSGGKVLCNLAGRREPEVANFLIVKFCTDFGCGSMNYLNSNISRRRKDWFT